MFAQRLGDRVVDALDRPPARYVDRLEGAVAAGRSTTAAPLAAIAAFWMISRQPSIQTR